MSGRVTGPSTGHLVHAGDLAYAAMGQGNLLVPVRVERIVANDAVGTDQKHLRVTVYVTGTREPFRRGERLV